ncbi:DNA-processing protein DprA [Patescibacteria group bacterium]|nr:DNA-processing protein DprA [Patescibacteria group bacterium]
MDKHLIALSYLDNLGPITLQKILEKLEPPKAWSASFIDLQKIGLPEKIALSIISQRKNINPDKIVEQINKEGINVLTIFDDAYPKLLEEIYAPPIVLYYRGKVKALSDQTSLAVVGSRKISNYAQNIMPDLLEPVIKHQVTITSGLAHGVDSLAHQLALKNNGKTIAVLGSGLAYDYLYPKSNRYLADKIIESGGIIVSEFPPFIPAQPFNFPRRNRIISGLSQGVLIIEASQKSGALITAAYALEQNREVMAVPGNINQQNSAGANSLIKKGAKVITGPADIFESLNIFYNQEPKKQIDYQSASEEEQIILKIISGSPMHIDKIIEHCTLETSVINSALLQMELRGWIKNLGGQSYIKS